ncbi:sigma-54-dependent transcriptional regulator [Alkalitalea saponilacus]|uniref:Two-component system, NtrC family, response regulator HydG n=1 Tax=Alkalitalea saponilacus TaxID=889453 RepID=A0A1T5GM33_9BACT|nr:sigma-54 dependent transcriptional regulator [Alkalitalea saponilacus]ASB48279.1 sigma-54-dependent Fis family transcriptional regulator [Alkalitalea saponilacus]SKC09476.1 two-component system, NtrC family, response regulator HydG [Alkalitalea saponilacus]
MENILIVEDDIAFAKMLETFLTKKGYIITHTSSIKNSTQLLNNQRFDLCLLDYRLPDGSALDFLQTRRDLKATFPVIIMTAFSDVRTVVKSMKMGAAEYITKPVNPEELMMVLKLVSEQEKTPSQTKEKKSKTTQFVQGKSHHAQKLQEFIDLVAPTDISVIIQGESGTGKEYVARKIHQQSRRAKKPFIPIDCGVLSKDLAAGELFGYVKGAFTGALINRTGQFEKASGGTLFLDEIGNLSYDVQVKLLRALQEKTIQPLGSDALVEVDIRIIVATNESLITLVKNGVFREDLYHRLNEFKIDVPPLRERVDDMELFIGHFIEEANKDLQRDVRSLAEEAMQVFREYEWPGNLRELRNTIRRMVLLTQEKIAEADKLPSEMLSHIRVASSTPSGSNLKAIQAETEKEHIIKVLESVQGNKSKAARILNIDRKTLYNKLERYDLT